MAAAHLNIEVVIVGGGDAGASAALHLARAGVPNVLVLECGEIGRGASSGRPLVSHAETREGDVDVVDDGSGCSMLNAFPFARKSGTAVFEDPVSAMKMVRKCISDGCCVCARFLISLRGAKKQ